MTKLFFFNGPPRSGKDTAAQFMYQYNSAKGPMIIGAKHNRAHFDRFSMPCKSAFAAIVGAEMDVWGNVEPYESTKGEIIPWLGVSYRQWQIDFSENFMKPQYGNDIFGRLFCQRNKDKKGAIFIPDSGFREEAEYIASQFGVENILLIRVHRPGFDFTGDSRSYLYDVVPNEVDVVNDSSQEEYYGKIKALVSDFMGV